MRARKCAWSFGCNRAMASTTIPDSSGRPSPACDACAARVRHRRGCAACGAACRPVATLAAELRRLGSGGGAVAGELLVYLARELEGACRRCARGAAPVATGKGEVRHAA